MAAKSPGIAIKCCAYICNPRRLLTFGVPLLFPSVILTAIAFVSFPDFGVIHIVGIILLLVSVICIFFGALIMLCGRKKQTTSKISRGSSILADDSQHKSEQIQENGTLKRSQNLISTRNQHSNDKQTVKNMDPPRRPRKQLKNTRGRKDVKKSKTKLPTVTEDKEGEIFRILSAGAVSRKSLSSFKLPKEARSMSMVESRPMAPPVINVWREDTIVSARSDFSVVSDSSIYFTQDIELTPIEVLENTSCLLPFPTNPPLRSLSLSNILEGSSSDTTDTEQGRKQRDSLSDSITSSKNDLNCCDVDELDNITVKT